ncbi:hypothetical protein IW261DRAFT_1625867 [Armillaria novae-zelandiae]|uniref:Uncharacterized protein n=1 Tax=Armillaria novae-zelandiae TaxID=153914 RepID=A0AA39NCW8_9AGAR|nr:hypothetical protein IW261DRAFT_1625867 [Armillaria novae-zelandiae]
MLPSSLMVFPPMLLLLSFVLARANLVKHSLLHVADLHEPVRCFIFKGIAIDIIRRYERPVPRIPSSKYGPSLTALSSGRRRSSLGIGGGSGIVLSARIQHILSQMIPSDSIALGWSEVYTCRSTLRVNQTISTTVVGSVSRVRADEREIVDIGYELWYPPKGCRWKEKNLTIERRVVGGGTQIGRLGKSISSPSGLLPWLDQAET